MIEHLYINDQKTKLQAGDLIIYKEEVKTMGFYRAGRRIYLGDSHNSQRDDKLTTVLSHVSDILKNITLFSGLDLIIIKDGVTSENLTKWMLVENK